mmetsp:Transcript_92957/g.289317  ORF Transcript_92957/g.289317 Transcript_92957/m.289317 type:complete len:287 (-) Transcript_92957:706-1566(-)
MRTQASMPSVMMTEGCRSQSTMSSICPRWAPCTSHSLGRGKTYSGESTGLGSAPLSKMRPEMTSAASPPSLRRRISSRWRLALATTCRMQTQAREPRSVPTKTLSSSGQARARAVMPALPPSSEAPPGELAKPAWPSDRVTLLKKLYVRNGRTDQKMMQPSASAVTMSGASLKWRQHVTGLLPCVTSHVSELLTCLAKSMLYQKTSPSSDTPVIISRPSKAICSTGAPALLRSMRFSTKDLFGSLSSWTRTIFSAEESDRTLPGMHSIWVTSYVCGDSVFSKAPQA